MIDATIDIIIALLYFNLFKITKGSIMSRAFSVAYGPYYDFNIILRTGFSCNL